MPGPFDVSHPFVTFHPHGGGERSFWLMPSDSRVQYAGFPVASWAIDDNLNGGATGITCISGVAQHGVRQWGYLRQVKYNIVAVRNGQISTRVFRKNGVNYDFVGKSDDIVTGTGEQTVNLSTPIPVRPGDIIGFYVGALADAPNVYVTTGGTTRYVFADVQVTNAFSGTVGFTMDLVGFGVFPYLSITGDSIAGGYYTYQPFYGGGPTGYDPANDPGTMLRNRINSNQSGGFECQNHALGAQTWAWVLSTGIVSAIATGCKAIMIHCGVNDINNGRAWAAVLADMDAVRALVPSTVKLYIREILPWTNGSDAQAAIVRAWNANYSTWCAANNATLIVCHDEMGQVRPSTGELDNLLTAYNADGVHPNLTGYAKLAEIDDRYI